MPSTLLHLAGRCVAPARAIARRLRILTAATGCMLIASCSSIVDTTAPHDTGVALAPTGSPKALMQTFLDAQGTYCVRDIPGDCDVIDNYGLGYILGWCEFKCVGEAVSVDFSGVNREWWDRNGLAPFSSPFSATGAVSETRLADGRRRIVANIHARNTFVLFSTQGLSGVQVGADFFEYPIISQDPRTPVLGDVSFSAEMIVPATFEGMPDVTHFFFFPLDGMELRRVNVTVNTTGPLRGTYQGLAAGTMVDVHGTFVYLPKLASTGMNSRRMIANGYESVSRITVKPAAQK